MGDLMARGLLYKSPEETSMDKPSGKEEQHDRDTDVDREDPLRRLLDEQGGNNDTFNPRTGEDPGALPLTEDPLERRSKRTTM
jgi:hypothetical protein